jgi:hypothetical protein
VTLIEALRLELKKRKLRARNRAAVIFWAVVLSPVGFIVISSPFYGFVIEIHSLIWIFRSDLLHPFFIPWLNLLINWPMLLLRLPLVHQTYWYYMEEVPRERILFTGTLGEAPGILMMILRPLASGPIPILLFFALFLVYRYPGPDPALPWDKQEVWWDKSGSEAEGDLPHMCDR